MTVRQKMDNILNNNPDYQDSGEYNFDHGKHGILQNMKNGSIKVIYESKDDINENDTVSPQRPFPNGMKLQSQIANH